MERRLHLLESFTARGSDGETYKVRGYEHLVRDESLSDGREHWEPTGLAEYQELKHIWHNTAPKPAGWFKGE